MGNISSPKRLKRALNACLDVWLVYGQCTVADVEGVFPRIIGPLNEAERNWLHRSLQHAQDRLDYHEYQMSLNDTLTHRSHGRQYDVRKQLPKQRN